MTIGIISEYNDMTLNYGNVLQTYALNHYISTHYECSCETIRVSYSPKSKIRTQKISANLLLKKMYKKIMEIVQKGDFDCKKQRLNNFHDFEKRNITLSRASYQFEDFPNLNYDVYIVGSDVVWNQYRCGVNRLKFLDFEEIKKIKRIAYAASLGKDWIPKENVPYIKSCLLKFDAISVRERSSVDFFKSIGIDNVEHCCDPTLLLDKREWEKLECKPNEINEKKFVFVYLLSEDKAKFDEIKTFCNGRNLIVVNIPFASGLKSRSNSLIGDKCISDCSPQNWIWLIHHSDYIFTDSFHGLIFSVMFENKFFVFERSRSSQGNRLKDFLNYISENDKLISELDSKEFDNFNWNYDMINKKIDKLKASSKLFLNMGLSKN